jgi:hypothetical protein
VHQDSAHVRRLAAVAPFVLTFAVLAAIASSAQGDRSEHAGSQRPPSARAAWGYEFRDDEGDAALTQARAGPRPGPALRDGYLGRASGSAGS